MKKEEEVLSFEAVLPASVASKQLVETLGLLMASGFLVLAIFVIEHLLHG